MLPDRLDEDLEQLGLVGKPLVVVEDVVGEVVRGALGLLQRPLGQGKLGVHVDGTPDDGVTVVGKAVEAKLLCPAGRQLQGVYRELVGVVADIVAVGYVGVAEGTVREQGGGLVAGKLVHAPPGGPERRPRGGHLADALYLGIGYGAALEVAVVGGVRAGGGIHLAVLAEGGHLPPDLGGALPLLGAYAEVGPPLPPHQPAARYRILLLGHGSSIKGRIAPILPFALSGWPPGTSASRPPS